MKIINKFQLFFTLCVVFLLITTRIHTQSFDWSPLGNSTTGIGTNGYVYAISEFNGNIIAAGSFTQAGNTQASNIAAWNGSSWQSLGLGLNGEVYALDVYNNELYAGGSFTMSGGTPVSRIAKWNGSAWSAVGAGLNDEVKALTVYNSKLIIGGNFTNTGQRICAWDGNNWVQMGSGVDDEVLALTVYSGDLVAAGRFSYAGGVPANKIAKWNGSAWSSLSSSTNERIHALGVYNSNLIAGGRFTSIGGAGANYIASYNGSSWSSIGGGVDDRVLSIATFRGELIIGGQLRNAGNNLYVDRIAKWNGSVWSRMITGMNEKVNTLFVKDSTLYAGGEFITAGGKVVKRIAKWSNQITSTISGEVRYSDNNQLVSTGKVRAFRIDLNSRELILIDSTTISNGNYELPKVRPDSTYIIAFPDDELLDFVPTYHPSTLNWASAVVVFPITNLTDVNVNVYRITSGQQDFISVSVGGYVYLNYLPPFNPPPLPFKSDAIIYAKQGNTYRKFAVSSQTEQYSILNLAPGTYEFYVNRPGYTSALTNVTVGTANIDTLNFILDTTSIIGIQNISSEVPKEFLLGQNYPNPFNPVTKIEFALTKESYVKLRVFNILGEEVQVLVNENLKAGKYGIVYNAERLPSGVYFYTIAADGFLETKKMILIK
jgi:hypothetical protein